MKYLPGKKAAALLGIHQNTLRKYADRGIIPSFKTASGQRRYDVDAYLNQPPDIQTVCYCRVSSNEQKDDLQRQVLSMQEQFPHATIITDVAGGLNWQRKGLVSILERLHRGDKLQIVVAHRDRLARFGFELIQWLVERNGGAVLVLNHRTQAPNQNSPKIFSPSSILSLAGSTDSAATARLSKRIRVYPNREQKKTVKLWFDAARWRYNQTIETLRQPDTTANWKKIKTPIIKAIPSHLAPAPYQVKSIAVRDACKAVSNAKIFNTGLKKDQAAGIRLDETFAEPGF